MTSKREEGKGRLRFRLLDLGIVDEINDLKLDFSELEELIKPETAMEEEMADRHRDIEKEFDIGMKQSIWQMLFSGIVLFIIVSFVLPRCLQITEIGCYFIAIPFVLFAIVIVQFHRLRKNCDLKHATID